jgi:arsenate reductase
MAEGLLRDAGGDRFEATSAGTEKTGVRPLAVQATGVIGVDISGQEPKTLTRFVGEPFDYVVTVCEEANEACPVFPGARERLHWSMPDPAAAVAQEGVEYAVCQIAGVLRGAALDEQAVDPPILLDDRSASGPELARQL